MAWSTPRTWVAGELVTAAYMNSNIRDNENALLAGLVGVGFTEIDLLGAASAPGAAGAGHAVIYYDTTVQAILASLNAGAFSPIGIPTYRDPYLLSGWRELRR